MNDTSQDGRSVARKRWHILAQVLREGDSSSVTESSVSVRRFQTYGLLSTEAIKLDDVDCSENWFLYTCLDIPGFSMSIRHLSRPISAETLNGFNNTGNVCVWPSEEVMTYYCMQHVEDFKGHRVCELGGGMTCLAGVALAKHSEASHVELSDGNDDSVDNLNAITDRNHFSSTSVGSRVLRWGCGKIEESLEASFDSILCADCLFFDEGRADLATLIFSLLKPGGQALIFAPSRNETFQKFSEIASTIFKVEASDQYDSRIWSLHLKTTEDLKDTYDKNLHFPKMMKLLKPVTSQREVTPESR